MPYPYYPTYQPQYQQYFPASYQPIQQQTVQPVQQTPPVQPPQVSNVWIYNEAEIPGYPVAPNNAVRLWVTNKPVFYEKSADATGKPTIKVFDYAERKETPSENVSADGGKQPDYATKDELSAVLGVVKGFDSLIASMKSDIEKMNGDLYGIAGKKRAAKKQPEAEEDDE